MSRSVPERRRVESPNYGRRTGKRPAEPQGGLVGHVVRPIPGYQTGRGHQTGLARLVGRGHVIRPGGQAGHGRRPFYQPTGQHRHEHGADQNPRHPDSLPALSPVAQRRGQPLGIERGNVDNCGQPRSAGPPRLGLGVGTSYTARATRMRVDFARQRCALPGPRRPAVFVAVVYRTGSGRRPGARAAVRPGPPRQPHERAGGSRRA
jgi:hypothetical protein